MIKNYLGPSKPWAVKQKNGDLYGYANCAAGNVDRQPIAITTDQLKKINESESMGSGRDAYSDRRISTWKKRKYSLYVFTLLGYVSKNITFNKRIR